MLHKLFYNRVTITFEINVDCLSFTTPIYSRKNTIFNTETQEEIYTKIQFKKGFCNVTYIMVEL